MDKEFNYFFLKMDEETKVEEVKEEKTEDIVEEAKKVALEMKAGLDERKKIVEREEKLLARQETLKQLGGGSLAGSRPEIKTESPQEYKDRILRGEI